MHAELAKTVDLVAPEVDPNRDLARRGKHVDDGAAHRYLPAVFDLVLASVAEPDQGSHEVLGVEGLSGPHDDRFGFLDMWPEALQERLHRSNQHERHVHAGVEMPHRLEPTTHRFDTRTHPFKREGLPCRKYVDLGLAEVRPKVIRHPFGFGSSCGYHQQWAPLGDGA